MKEILNEKVQGMPSKMDGILEGPESQEETSKSMVAPEGKGPWKTDICDDCCEVCPASVHHGGKCHGSEHMAEYEAAKAAMKNIELYFEQYVDGMYLNSVLQLTADALKAAEPMLKPVETDCANTPAAIQMLGAKLEQDLHDPRATSERKEIIQACLADLEKVKQVLE